MWKIKKGNTYNIMRRKFDIEFSVKARENIPENQPK